MIMAQKLDVRLRILIPAAENSISGDAFRPGDVLRSRAGTTVEIGNTDAEGPPRPRRRHGARRRGGAAEHVRVRHADRRGARGAGA